MQKRICAIHDLSGFGKCSLTVALPIISATGIEVAAIPTAVLSTHTGGIEGFTYRDLTDDIMPIADHWKSLDIKFDSIYSGFLGSMRQIDIVSKIFDKLSDDNTFIMVDPCMADNGKIYKTYTLEMADKVKKLCMKADLIVPNLTEACLLLDIPYVSNSYTSKDIFDMAKQLSNKFSSNVVLTGVGLEKGSIGAVFLEVENIGYAFTEKVEGSYHGTGDIFASVLISALMNGKSLAFSTQIAANFTKNCIKRTFESKKDKRYGVNFEFGIPELIKELGDK